MKDRDERGQVGGSSAGGAARSRRSSHGARASASHGTRRRLFLGLGLSLLIPALVFVTITGRSVLDGAEARRLVLEETYRQVARLVASRLSDRLLENERYLVEEISAGRPSVDELVHRVGQWERQAPGLTPMVLVGSSGEFLLPVPEGEEDFRALLGTRSSPGDDPRAGGVDITAALPAVRRRSPRAPRILEQRLATATCLMDNRRFCSARSTAVGLARYLVDKRFELSEAVYASYFRRVNALLEELPPDPRIDQELAGVRAEARRLDEVIRGLESLFADFQDATDFSPGLARVDIDLYPDVRADRSSGPGAMVVADLPSADVRLVHRIDGGSFAEHLEAVLGEEGPWSEAGLALLSSGGVTVARFPAPESPPDPSSVEPFRAGRFGTPFRGAGALSVLSPPAVASAVVRMAAGGPAWHPGRVQGAGSTATLRAAVAGGPAMPGQPLPADAASVPLPGLAGWSVVAFPRTGSLDAVADRELLHNALWLAGSLLVLAVGATLAGRSVHRELQLARMRSDFVASVSHELKTPLALMSAAAENLQAGWVPAERRAGYYDSLVGETRRLSDLVDNILDFRRLEAGARTFRFRLTDLRDLVDEAAARHHAQLEAARVDLQVGYPDRPVLAEVDRDGIRQILTNLLSNAIKYMSGEERRVGIALGHHGDRVRIRVTDTGIGVPADEVESIFDSFVRGRAATDSSVAGSGIGLTIVRHIARAHDGDVSVEGEPGRGSIFIVDLAARTGRGDDHGGTT